MKIHQFTLYIVAFIWLFFTSVLFAQNSHYSTIELRSCDLDIKADHISRGNQSIKYSGNVEFRYGLANVKTGNVMLVKNQDGSCQLVAQPWFDKSSK